MDLLPSPDSSGWSHNIPTDDGHEMDQVFSFDGQNNALEVPESVFNHMLHEQFTISAWLRHGDYSATSQSKAPKEHIFCMSDGNGEYMPSGLFVENHYWTSILNELLELACG